MVCRILVFMWSFGPLLISGSLDGHAWWRIGTAPAEPGDLAAAFVGNCSAPYFGCSPEQDGARNRT